MRKRNKLLFGVGLNDLDYEVYTSKIKIIEGFPHKIKVVCPYYRVWVGMLERCYSKKEQDRKPKYKGTTVQKEWLRASVFKAWMEQQDWKGKQLDKDLLSGNTKHYSSNTAIFISQALNKFMVHGSGSGSFLLGVTKAGKSFQASCKNLFTKNKENLGTYPTELEAHKAWQAKKHEYACQLADMQEDERVAKALRERYAPDKDWTKA